MKLLYLTSVIIVPSQAGEEKIERALNKKTGEKRDDYNRNAEWYQDMNLPVPDHLLEEDSDMDSDGNIFLREEEMEWDFMDCIINLKNFQTAIDNQQIGCVVYTQQGDEIHVSETVEEVFSYINYLTRPWNERVVDFIKNKWWRIRYFWRKKVDYKEILSRPENQPDYTPPTEEKITN